jgi:hypothetical protein
MRHGREKNGPSLKMVSLGKLNSHAEMNDIRLWLPGHYRLYEVRPRLHCPALFIRESVPLIDAGHTAETAGRVV